jgi:hypothetical protein
MLTIPSWSTGSVGGGVRYGGAVLRSDAAPGLGRKVQLGPKLPPAAESKLPLRQLFMTHAIAVLASPIRSIPCLEHPRLH